ncbi:MAG: succinylglutamate desuccinylase/aspartoacylase family protein, partial [Chlorobi bacterium]|nr:succinylglutamate desuccinylase/aspartoacylase family protein [Chlorobiota bacterium]
DMLHAKFKISKPKKKCVVISESKWIRAKYSGMFRASALINKAVNKGDIIGHITDPFGKFHHFVKAENSGYIFNVNQAPIVYKGDALFHISTQLA